MNPLTDKAAAFALLDAIKKIPASDDAGIEMQKKINYRPSSDTIASNTT